MVRDCLMQTVVSGDKEPITPFTLQARELNEKHAISIVHAKLYFIFVSFNILIFVTHII